MAQTVKHLPTMQKTRVRSWVGKIPWRRKWQPTPVLLPRKFHGWRSLVGYSPWGRKESDTTERLHFLLQGIFPIQGSTLSLSHCRQIFYHLSHQGRPLKKKKKKKYHEVKNMICSIISYFSNKYIFCKITFPILTLMDNSHIKNNLKLLFETV